jgi:hypothetical protein
MEYRIIYPNDDGTLAIVSPTPDFLENVSTIMHVALKDVPPGKPFKIIPFEVLPTDYTYWASWEYDFTDNDGYGADYGTGSDNDVIAWNADGTPVIKVKE